MKKTALIVAMLAMCALPAQAMMVDVDLSGAVSGTYIDGGGASFAQTFSGQTVSGISIVGAPTDPLTLVPSGTLEVAFWDGSNSILPQPGNTGPLSILLDIEADFIRWRMGSASGGSVHIDFFDYQGNVVHSVNQALLDAYNYYEYSGFGLFRGLTISENTDPAGLRYQNFSYNAVPLPGALWLLGTGLVGLAGMRRRFKR